MISRPATSPPSMVEKGPAAEAGGPRRSRPRARPAAEEDRRAALVRAGLPGPAEVLPRVPAARPRVPRRPVPGGPPRGCRPGRVHGPGHVRTRPAGRPAGLSRARLCQGADRVTGRRPYRGPAPACGRPTASVRRHRRPPEGGGRGGPGEERHRVRRSTVEYCTHSLYPRHLSVFPDNGTPQRKGPNAHEQAHTCRQDRGVASTVDLGQRRRPRRRHPDWLPRRGGPASSGCAGPRGLRPGSPRAPPGRRRPRRRRPPAPRPPRRRPRRRPRQPGRAGAAEARRRQEGGDGDEQAGRHRRPQPKATAAAAHSPYRPPRPVTSRCARTSRRGRPTSSPTCRPSSSPTSSGCGARSPWPSTTWPA